MKVRVTQVPGEPVQYNGWTGEKLLKAIGYLDRENKRLKAEIRRIRSKMNETETGLDRERIEELTAAILLPVRANYMRGPISRDRAYEALNALAAAVGVVIKGCDGDDPRGEAMIWFEQALGAQTWIPASEALSRRN